MRDHKKHSKTRPRGIVPARKWMYRSESRKLPSLEEHRLQAVEDVLHFQFRFLNGPNKREIDGKSSGKRKKCRIPSSTLNKQTKVFSTRGYHTTGEQIRLAQSLKYSTSSPRKSVNFISQQKKNFPSLKHVFCRTTPCTCGTHPFPNTIYHELILLLDFDSSISSNACLPSRNPLTTEPSLQV